MCGAGAGLPGGAQSRLRQRRSRRAACSRVLGSRRPEVLGQAVFPHSGLSCAAPSQATLRSSRRRCRLATWAMSRPGTAASASRRKEPVVPRTGGRVGALGVSSSDSPPAAERGGAPRGRAHGHGLLREHRASAPQPAPPARPSPRTVLNQGAHPAQARLAWRDSLPLQAQACPLSPSGRSALAGGTRRTGPRCPPRALPLGLPLTFQAVGAPACWRGSASRLMQDAGGAPDTSLQDADGSQLVPQRWPLDLGLSAVQAMKDGRMRSVLDRPPQPSDGTHGHPTGLPYWLLGSLTLTPCAPRGRDTSWF